MKCSLCNKVVEEFCSKNASSVHEIKQKEILKLKQQLKKQRVKYNEALERKFGQTTSNLNNTLQNVETLQPSKILFYNQLQKIAKKQNTIAQIKRLKQKIEEKKELLQRRNLRRNQKLKSLSEVQNTLHTLKAELLPNQEEKLTEIKQKIKEKTSTLKNLNTLVKKHLDETIIIDLASILAIHRVYRVRESEKLFHFKKVDELDFLNFDQMAQSFYQVENIEEIAIKNKLSQKGVHVMLQNVLILKILQKICNFWLPYPIDCKIDFRLSRMVGKFEKIRVCGRKLVDQVPIKAEEFSIQALEKPEFDEEIEYNKRIYALNKEFISFMQMNIEFLSMKLGIQKRPFIFFENDLMASIQKEFFWMISFVEKAKFKPCPIKPYITGYNSMLKELKMTKLIDSLENMHSMKLVKSEFAETNKTIPEEVESEEEIQKGKESVNEISKSETIIQSYLGSFSKFFSFAQSVYEPEPEVPESLENVQSYSTDNDDFQTLEPQ